MLPSQKNHEPIQQSVHVDCSLEDAFRLFTDGFAEWWPLALYSITGAKANRCEMEPWRDGRVFERTNEGEEHDWGSVLEWDPPKHLRLSWHPGSRDEGSQTVDVEFTVEAQGTRVTVIHTGWEAHGVGVCSLQRDSLAMWQVALKNYFSVVVWEQMLVIA